MSKDGDVSESEGGVRGTGYTLRVLALAAIGGLFALAYFQVHLINPAFRMMFAASIVAFVIHAHLPMAARMPFFLAISIAGILYVMDPVPGLVTIALALLLVGICHLPLPLIHRILILACAGIFLAAFRVGVLPLPRTYYGKNLALVAITTVAILLMFRIAIYLYETEHEKEKAPLATRLAYFFMFPNPIFPVFPIVDYNEFKSTFFKEKAIKTYTAGISLIAEGTVQVLLYRIVKTFVMTHPDEVHDVPTLIAYLATGYLLYLHVSGTFHMIVGCLHLFGFKLPRTHNNYLLAESVTDVWRRINIYYYKFMETVVYYPVYFRIRKKLPRFSMVVATLVVFVVTALVHPYQAFWQTGEFDLHLNDVIFWTLLGLIVTRGTWPQKKGKRRKRKKKNRLPRRVFNITVQASTMFFLWSLWTCEDMDEWIGAFRSAFG